MTGPGGRGVVRVGRLGRFGTGACPNLLQRRPAAGSAASRSAEYQRFSSGASARSGSLQQIWTTGVAAGPCTDGDLLVRGPEAGPTGRGPLHGRRPRRSLRSWTGPAPTPGCRGVHFALERALLTAPFECKMHISRAECTSRRAQDRPAPPTTPDGPSPHRPAPTPVPDHDPRRERPSGLTAALFCLDHLRALGPLMFRWTTCVRLDHLVHEIRWSNGTQVVQPHLSGPSRPRASRHARRRPTMRDALSGRGEGVAGEPPRRPARPIPTSPASPRDDRPVDPIASDALQHTRRRPERIIAVDLPHPAPPPPPDNPLHHTRETHSDAR